MIDAREPSTGAAADVLPVATRSHERSIVADSVKRRPWLFGVMLCAIVAAGLIWTYLRSPIYEVRSTLLFPLKPRSLLTTKDIGSAASAVAGLTGPSAVRQNEFILDSLWSLEQVSVAAGIPRLDLQKMRDFETNPAANTITIRVHSTSPAEAQRVARLYVSTLQKAQVEANIGGEQSDLNVLRKSIDEQNEQVKAAQNKLAAFQRRQIATLDVVTSGTGESGTLIVVPGPWLEERRRAELELNGIDVRLSTIRKQVEEASSLAPTLPTEIPGVKGMRERLVDLEMQLASARAVSGPESPDVLRLTELVRSTRESLTKEVTAYLHAFRSNVVNPDLAQLIVNRVALSARIQALRRLSEVAPSEAAAYQRLLQTVATETASYNRLKGQLALAKVLSQVDENRWTILDDAEVVDKPINKSYSVAGIEFLALGILLATLSTLALQANDHRRLARSGR